MKEWYRTGIYPSDGAVVDANGKETGEFARGFWDDEEYPEHLKNRVRPKRKPSRPPADWGPERRRRRWLALEAEKGAPSEGGDKLG